MSTLLQRPCLAASVRHAGTLVAGNVRYIKHLHPVCPQVLDFFNVRMDASRLSLGEVSVERVLEVVVANARQWRGEGMKVTSSLFPA
jgi:hypothetical protein